jgi:hypothetical protein
MQSAFNKDAKISEDATEIFNEFKSIAINEINGRYQNHRVIFD